MFPVNVGEGGSFPQGLLGSVLVEIFWSELMITRL